MRNRPTSENGTQRVGLPTRLAGHGGRALLAFVLAVTAMVSLPTLAFAERWGSATYAAGTYTETLTQANAADVTATFTPTGISYTHDGVSTTVATNNGLTTFPQKSATSAMFTPNVPSGTSALGFITSAEGCRGSGNQAILATCANRGTIVITFSRPVTNPSIHIMGLGGSSGTGSTATAFAATGTLTSSPAGATMAVGSGATNLSVGGGGTSFATTTTRPGTQCNATPLGFNGTAGCGTLQVTGANLTSITLSMSILVSASNTTALQTGNGDHFVIVLSLPDQPMPTATPDTASVVSNGTVTINPLANDTPASGIALVPGSTVFTATAGWTLSGDGKTLSNATYGTFTMNADGTVLFDPVDTYSGAVPPVNYRITDAAGSTATSTITVTVIPRPVIVLRKTTVGGTGGPFNFTLTNTTQTTGTATTTTAGTAVQVDGDTVTAGTQAFTVANANQAVVITESSVPATWGLASASCTNGGSNVGTLSGGALTLPASATVPGATITCDFTNAKPAITLTKTAGTASGNTAGSTVPYTFTVTNTGLTSLSGIAVTDNKLSGVTCNATTLAAGASTTCSGTYTLTQADVNAGQVVNDASVKGTPPVGTDVTATATNTKTIPAAPSLTITKTAGTLPSNTAGVTLPYSFAVTNTGNVTLTSVGVTDPKIASISCLANSLAPGASTTCTGNYPVTQGDVDAGVINNTATASGTPPTGSAVTASDDESKTITRSASLTVSKTAGTPTGNSAGSTIGYSFVVKNTGNVTLTGIIVDDPKVATMNCPATQLAPGASMTCTGTHTITQTEVNAGQVLNTVTVNATPPTGVTPPTASDGPITVPLTRTPGITVDKQYSGASGSSAGSTINYTFLVTNTGNVTLTGVTVTDPKATLSGCSLGTLAPGGTATCTGTHTLTQAEVDAGHIANTATTTGTPPSGLTAPTGTDSLDTAVPAGPTITLVKSAGPITDADGNGTDVDDTVAYTFLVTNTGNVTLSGLAISDSKIASVSCPVTTLAPGANTTCDGTYTLTQSDVNLGTVANTATATATAPSGATATATSTASKTIDRNSSLVFDKQVGTPTGSAVGSTVPYTFIVTNSGNVTLTGVGITDNKLSSITCPGTTLAPAATMTCTGSYTLTQADINAGAVNNTAQVTGTPPSGVTAPTAADSTSVTITRSASITLTKTAGTPTGNTVGSTITYTFVVKNTGNVTLTNAGITDAKVGTVTCPDTTLAPGASTTCTAVYPLTQPDIDLGTVHNSATATGTPPSGMSAPTAIATADSTIARNAAITLDKTAGAPSPVAAGGTVVYSFLVKNTGNVTLTGIIVDDPKVLTMDCPATELAPGEPMTCTGTHTLSQAEVDAGSVVNTATVNATPPSGVTAPSATDSVTTLLPADPKVDLVKTAGSIVDANSSGRDDAGDTVGYSFVATNTGNVTLHNVTVTDPKVPSLSCTIAALAPLATNSCSATYTLTQADLNAGTLVNNATVTGTPPVGAAVTDAATTTTAIARTSSLSLDKQAGTPSVNAVGGTIVYTFVVQNTGTVTVTGLSVTDPKVPSISCLDTTLQPGATTTCTGTHTITQTEVDAGVVNNTATVTGTVPSGVSTPSATDSTSQTLLRSPKLVLDKQAGAPTGSVAGAKITYSFSVTNTGNVTLDPVTVSDPLVLGASTMACPGPLAPGASVSCGTQDYTLTQTDVDAGHVANTATATGTGPGASSATSSDSTDTPITGSAAIDLTKSAASIVDANTSGRNDAGDTILYTFSVNNPGNVTLHNVTVTDPKIPGLSCTIASLAPGATESCTSTYTLTLADVNAGSIANTATASGTPPTGTAVSDTSSVTSPITQAPAISVVKHATTPATNFTGDTITYTFDVKNTGNVTLTSVGVTDAKVGPVSCPVSVLAPNASTTCSATYSLTLADVVAGHVTNTATAQGTPPTGSPVTADSNTVISPIASLPQIKLVKTASGPSTAATGGVITYSFAVTNTGNVTLHNVVVTDPKLPTLSCTAATLEPVATAPGAILNCSGDYTLTQADVDAGTVANTATANGLDPSDVTVDGTSSTTTPITRDAKISLDKQAPVSISNAVPGTAVPYTFVVSNTGNVTLTGLSFNDPGLSVSCPLTTLAPGGTTTCTASHSLTQGEIDSGSITNTATVTGTPPLGVTAPTATDSTATTLVPSNGLAVTKTAGVPTGNKVGDTITYTFVATNTGNVTLSNVSVTDAKIASLTCTVASLAPGASKTCTAVYTFTQADVDAGSVVNTADAQGTPPSGPSVTGSSPQVTTLIPEAPAITVDKSVVAGYGNTAGSAISYTFAVKNTGNVTLHNVAVTDPNATLTGCTIGTLAPNGTASCSGTHTLLQSEVDSGHLANTATATGISPATTTVTATDSTDNPIIEAPELTVVKSVVSTSGNTAGSTVNYRFVVTNTGTVTLHEVAISDAKIPGVACPATPVAPADSITCTASYSLTQADVNAGQVKNTAIATGVSPKDVTATASSNTVTTTIAANPSLTVLKKAAAPSGNAAGATIDYTFEVKNTGNVTLSAIAIADSKVASVTCPATPLDPGAIATCTGTYTVLQTDVDAGSVINTATGSGTPPTGSPVEGTSNTVTTPLTRLPSISLDKQAGSINDLDGNGPDAGDTVAYTFAITNTGNVTLHDIAITDAKATLTGCSFATLAPGAANTVTCSGVHTLTQAEVDAGSANNTAEVAGTAPDATVVKGTDSTSTAIASLPGLTMDKQAGSLSGNIAGSTIKYTFVVQNTGNVTLTLIHVTDTITGAVDCLKPTLAPSEITSCFVTYTLTQDDVDSGHIANSATVFGSSPTSELTQSTDTTNTPITAGPAIDVTKSGSTIADTNSSGRNDVGDTITYTFVVQNTGNVKLTGVVVTDPLIPSLTCTVASLNPAASHTCTATYAITQADVDNGKVINTAHAEGTPPTGPVKTDDSNTVTTTITAVPKVGFDKQITSLSGHAAGDTITYTFVVRNTGNVTLNPITLTDDTATLATACDTLGPLAPAASTSCTGLYTLTQSDIDTGHVANTAHVDATAPDTTAVSGTDSTDQTLTRTPTMTVAKSGSAIADTNHSGRNDVGDTITYTITVTNTGNVTLTGVAVTDPQLDAAPICDATTLAPGATATCTGTRELTQADVDNGQVDNTATATATPPTGSPALAPVNSNPVTTTITPDPRVLFNKEITGLSGYAAGDTISYTFVVSNTGNVTLDPITLSDDTATLAPACGTLGPLAPGGTTSCTGTHVLTLNEVNAGHVANHATLSATTPASGPLSATDSTDQPITQSPSMTVTKSGSTIADTNGSGRNDAGDTITYTITVTNVGNVTLTDVAVTDPQLDAAPICDATTLAPGATATCTGTRTLTQADVNNGQVVNTATATATPPAGSPALDPVDSNPVTTPITADPGMSVAKYATIPTGAAAGSDVTYRVNVTNTGNVTLTGVTVDDPLTTPSTLTCSPTTIEPGAMTSCGVGHYTLTQADLDAGVVHNTATATATPPSGPSITQTGSLNSPLTQQTSLTLSKHGDWPGAAPAVGQLVPYTFTVTNTGNVTLTDITVSDPTIGAVSCPTESLDAGASLVCTSTASYEVTQADIDNGHVNNTATATGTPPSGSGLSDPVAQASISQQLDQVAGLTLSKNAGIPTGTHAGDTITYGFVVTNTGNVTLTGIAVSDPLISSISCAATTLRAGASTTCSGDYVIEQSDIDAGHITNTATVTGAPPATSTLADPSADATADKILVQAPRVELLKAAALPVDANSSGVTDAGDTVTYTFTVTNTGNVTLSTLAISDGTLDGPATCGATVLAPGADTTCTGVRTLTLADLNAGSVTNSASVTATDPGSHSISDVSDTTTGPDGSAVADPGADGPSTPTVLDLPRVPGLGVTKTGSGVTDTNSNGRDDVGDTISYTITVTNTGNVTVTDVAVTDPQLDAAPTCDTTTLNPGATATCTGTRELTQADVDNGQVDNTATATATPPAGSPALDPVDSNPVTTIVVATPGIDLVKTGTAAGATTGSEVTYTFAVTNTGNVTLHGVTVTDPLVGTVTCPSGDLAPGATVNCNATYALTQKDVDNGSVHNDATATATPPHGPAVEAPDGTDVLITPGPALDLVKSAGALTDSDGNGVDAGDTLTYRFVVTNTGNVSLHGVTVTDPLIPDVNCPSTSVLPGHSVTCTGAYVLTQDDLNHGSVTNNATAQARPPSGDPVSGSDGVVTPIAQHPRVSMVKSSDAVKALQADDLVTFSFAVTNTGNVVLNGVRVADPMLSSVTCPKTTLAPGESMTCTAAPYRVTAADARRGKIINTATAYSSFCPPAGCVALSTESTVTIKTKKIPDGSLAYTGATIGGSLLLGTGILGIGVVMLLGARRRREDSTHTPRRMENLEA